MDDICFCFDIVPSKSPLAAGAYLSVTGRIEASLLENSQISILCVEGARNNHFAFAKHLQRKGYVVHTAASGAEGIALLSDLNPTVIVINAASLRTNGVRITKRFRALLPECPIVLIVNKDPDESAVPEANNVLTLPFTVQKLVNRIRTFQTIENRHLHKLSALLLNTRSNMVTCNGKEAHLTPRLAKLLLRMMEEPETVLPREELFRKVWDTSYTGDTRTLDVHISWLRKALEEDPHRPAIILTVRSIGYRLRVPQPKPEPAD